MADSDDRTVRARDLGIPFDGTPGPLNAITDVAGVTVGHTTLIEDLDNGRAVRTGVTAILPRGRDSMDKPVFAGTFALNGNGEMTGTIWVEESGMLEGPVMITNTHSVGVVRDAVIQWRVTSGGADDSRLLVVAAGGGGDLGRLPERHQRLPREARARLPGAGKRRGRTGCRGQRRWRHRHDLPRVQGRYRHRLPRRHAAATATSRWACWCRPITGCATCCASPACRSGGTCASNSSTRTPRWP